jgi:DnaJ domain
MIYTDWKAYQDALSQYERSLRAYNRACEEWKTAAKREGDDSTLLGWACIIFIGAIIVSYAAGSWLSAGVTIGVYYFGYRLRKYLNRGRPDQYGRSRPVFTEEKPEYRPLDISTDSRSPQSENVTTESQALELLGLAGPFSEEDLKRVYRQNILDYHPDRVAGLGQALRDLAEARTKQINQAYEILSRKANQSRKGTMAAS